MWIFGYGSLIWNPSFSYRDCRLARLDNWVRRFWQGSTDHRGVPGHPGRVVTLISEPTGDCWGVAYNCENPDSQKVIEKLDHREKGGYHRESVKLNFIDGSATQGLVYVAGPDNSDYLGPADEVDIVTIGDDWKNRHLDGLEWMQRQPGKDVVYFCHTPGVSTTGIKREIIKNSYNIIFCKDRYIL